MNKLVSIIMPSYNSAEFIRESIASVLAQTYNNWELIIVDDCSMDDTDKIVAEFADERIHYYKNERNSGAAVSRNNALKIANGKWVAFLDSDDLWIPEKLEKQISFMEQNGYHFSYTEYAQIKEDGQMLGVICTGPKKISNIKMHTYNYIGCLTVMYDREFIGEIQIADVKKRNDYAIWLKVIKKANCYLLPEILALYRIRESGSITSRNSGVSKLIKHHYILFKESEGENAVMSMFYTMLNLFFGVYKKVKYTKKQSK